MDGNSTLTTTPIAGTTAMARPQSTLEVVLDLASKQSSLISELGNRLDPVINHQPTEDAMEQNGYDQKPHINIVVDALTAANARIQEIINTLAI